MLNLETVLRRSRSWAGHWRDGDPPVPGVYFLVSGDVLLYVGQSSDAPKRIHHHPVRHERALVLPTGPLPKHERLKLEGRYVLRLEPRENREVKTRALGPRDVERIYRAAVCGRFSLRVVAKRFGVSHETVRLIRNGSMMRPAVKQAQRQLLSETAGRVVATYRESGRRIPHYLWRFLGEILRELPRRKQTDDGPDESPVIPLDEIGLAGRRLAAGGTATTAHPGAP